MGDQSDFNNKHLTDFEIGFYTFVLNVLKLFSVR